MKTPIRAALTAALLLSGCATYHPVPLESAAVLLPDPDPALLSAAAQSIDRPYLTPQAIDLSQPLSANAIAIIAVLENPDLKAQRAKAGVADAQAFAAGLLPDPSFSAGIDKLISGPDALDAITGALGFDLGALRTARVSRESARAAARQVRLDLAWAEWQVAGQARLQAVRILALEAQQTLLTETVASARAQFDRVERAAARGDLAANALDTERQALLDATDRLRTVETDLAAARNELTKLLGLPPHFALRLAASPAPVAPPASAALFEQAQERRLDLQALRAGYEGAEADLHKAVLDQFPNLALTLTGARDTGGNVTFGPAIDFTLPLWNRNRGGIAVARATREQVRAEYVARLSQTRAEIAAAVDGLALNRQQQADLVRQLPEIERVARATRRAADRGDVAMATARSAEQTLRDRELALLQLRQQASEQEIALELLVGELSEGWNR